MFLMMMMRMKISTSMQSLIVQDMKSNKHHMQMKNKNDGDKVSFYSF